MNSACGSPVFGYFLLQNCGNVLRDQGLYNATTRVLFCPPPKVSDSLTIKILLAERSEYTHSLNYRLKKDCFNCSVT